ncbi:hypothetical protein ABW19_dt0209552 [Dactylella cylindrospora]|nr:hypothetical protein ABW19_dt0209552 [Dactylella cylindrospora]
MAAAGMLEYELALGWELNACKAFKYFREILRLEQPKFSTFSEKDRKSGKIFYPISDVKKLFLRDGVLQDIISCSECGGCDRFPGLSGTKNHHLEQNLVIRSVMDPDRPRFILLAILVCMGQSYLIRYLDSGKFSDITLDNITNPTLLPPKDIRAWLPETISVEQFLDRFLMLRRRFDLKTFDRFHVGGSLEFDESEILPFHKDEPHSASSFGIVRKFEIYPCYNKIYQNGVQVTKFARKILKASITEDDFRYERDNLAFVNSLKNPNIIEMFCWYTTKKEGDKKEFTYVFPFMDASLQDILGGKDDIPEHLKYQPSTSLYHSRMWQEMVDVTAGLVAIHNPDSNTLIKNGLQPVPGGWLGYHFDIKPSNILVDSTGKFLITDFGLSVFKKRGSDETSTRAEESDFLYGQPGTPAYQPPGVQFVPGILPPGESQSQFDVPKLRRTYDVWSLACVMTEVITFVLGYDNEIGPAAVASFKNKRAADSTIDGSTAWHYRSSTANNEYRLKPSVEDWFMYMRRSAGAGTEMSDAYLSAILELLQEMFGIHTRSSSGDVLKRLTAANEREQARLDKEFSGRNNPREEQPFSINGWIKPRGREVLIYDSKTMAQYRIFFRDYYFEGSASTDSAPDPRLKLRPWTKIQALKVFQSHHREPKIRIVVTFKEQERDVAESESSVWKHEQFIPLYLYEDLSPDFQNCCAFRNVFIDRLLGFENPPDLHQFQKAILGYRRKSDYYRKLVTCFTDEERSTWHVQKDGARIEIWTTRDARENPLTPPYDDNLSGRGIPLMPTHSNYAMSPSIRGRRPSSIASGSMMMDINNSLNNILNSNSKKHDSMVVIFRPYHKDILMIPVLQLKTQLCEGYPPKWKDPLSLTFAVAPNMAKFTILRLVPRAYKGGLDPMDPISCVPGLPLELQETVARTRDDVDRITVFHRTSVSLRFKLAADRTEFIQKFHAAFPFRALFETAFYNTLVKTGTIRAT